MLESDFGADGSSANRSGSLTLSPSSGRGALRNGSAQAKRQRSRKLELTAIGCTLLAYAAMLAYAIPRHEPWADEAQAWELAKSTSLKSLFGTYLHYECSPGLWHFLLWIGARLHLSYTGMHWASGLVALAGVGVLLTFAPFPLPVRLLLPFTYFLAFQYAVVARSYVLFPLILFTLASFWKRRFDEPMPVFFTLGLLANLSAHGLAIAIGLAGVLGLEWFRSRQSVKTRSWMGAALLLLAMMAFAAWCMIPAKDAGWVVLAKQMQSHGQIAQLDLARSGYPWMKAFSYRFEVVLAILIELQHVLRHGIAEIAYLGLIAWGLLLWRLTVVKKLHYVLPVLTLAIPCTFALFLFYHAGIMWLLFLFLWWVTWPQHDREEVTTGGTRNWTEMSLLVCVVLCIGVQLSWAGRAFHYDALKTYSPDRDGAIVLDGYLRSGRTVDFAVPSDADGEGHGQFYVVGLEPYFQTQPFANMHSRFWFWGWDDAPRTQYIRDVDLRSVVVVVEEIAEDRRYEIEEKRLETLGYRRVKEVCGQAFYPDQTRPTLCHAFYEP